MNTPGEPTARSFWKKSGLIVATLIAALLSLLGVIALLAAIVGNHSQHGWTLSAPVIVAGLLTVAFIWLTHYLYSFLKAPPAVQPPYCECCGVVAPTIKVSINRHIGAIFFMFHKSLGGFLCKTCISKAFWQFTPVTFFFGWWGLVSVVVTPIVLINNLISYVRSWRLTEPERA